MTRTSRVLLSILVLGVGLLAAASPAAAGRKRIAVLDIEGARSGRLRAEIARIVESRHSVLSARAFAKAKRKTKTRKLNTAGVKKVARYLELDGVVEGMLIAEDDGYVLRLRLREGVSGKTARKFTVFLKSPRMTGKIRKQLSKRMHAAIARLEPILADEPNFDKNAFDDDDSDRARRSKTRKRRNKARRKPKRKPRRARELIGDRDIAALPDDDEATDDDGDDFDDDDGDDFDDDDGDDFDDDDDGDDFNDDDDGDDFDDGRRHARRRTRLGPRTAGITLNAGVAVIGRSLAFNYRADLDAPPSEYNGAYAPGAYVTGELYPLALTGKPGSLAANVGFGFDVERAVGLTSQVTGEAVMEPVALATQRQRYGFRAQYRHNFGSKPTHPSVVIAVGYNKLSFLIDRANIPDGVVIDVPNVKYSFIDPGLTLRLPIGAKLALSAAGKFLAVTGAGPMATPAQYGQAMVTGFDVDVAAEIHPLPHWLIRVGAHMTAIGFTFQEGAGELSSNRDGDLATLDVGGALDRYLGGYLTAGYMY